MANPITWRTVTGPSVADASRPLQIATQGILGGFGSFKDALGDFQKGEEAIWKKQDADATQAVLDQIYRAGTVDDFNRLQQSGALDQAVAANGARIDRAAVNALRDGRVAALQGREKAGWEFANAQLDQQEATTRDQIKGLLAKGDLEATKPLIQGLSIRGQASMWGALDQKERELVMRARDDIKFGYEAAREAHEQAQRPLQLEGLRLGNKGKEQGIALTGLQIQREREDAADRTQARALENEIATETARAVATRQGQLQAQAALARQLNIPVLPDGSINFNSLTPEQKALFDQTATGAGVPTIDAVTRGDTERANSFYQSLISSGRYSPRLLEANQARIRNAYNSVGGDRTLVGNDALRNAGQIAAQSVGFDRGDANNWYAPNSPDARRAYEELAGKLPEIVSSMPAGVWFGDNKKDIPALQALLGRIAAVGVKTKAGYVVPSPNDVLRFIRSEEGGFRDAKRAEDVEEKLKEWLESPEGIQMTKDGEKSRAWRDQQEIRKRTYEALGYGQPVKK